MSKKNKQKFKKDLKAQALQSMISTSSAPIKGETKQPEPVKVSAQAPQSENYVNLNLLKHDIKKTAILVGTIAIVILALFFADKKYGILAEIGNVVFKSLNLNI